MSDGGDIEGFRVLPDSVRQMRLLIDDVTSAQLRDRDAENSNDQAQPVDGGRRPGSWSMPGLVPGWHGQLDRRWKVRRVALLRTHDDVSGRLAECVRTYLETDQAGAARLRDELATHSHRQIGALNVAPGVLGVVPAVLDEVGQLTDLDHAAAVWRRRRDGAHDTIAAIENQLDDLIWTGAAASGFRRWADQLLHRWRDLRDAADSIGRALAEHRGSTFDGDEGPGPEVPSLSENPPPSLLPQHDPDRTAGHEAPADGDVTPAAADPVQGHEPTVTTPHDEPDTTDQNHATSQAQIPAPRDASDNSPSTSSAPGLGADTDPMAMAPRPVLHHDGAPSGTGTTAAVSPSAPSGDPNSPMPPMMPSTAIAGATALARADREYHVVRDISVPPLPNSHDTPDRPLPAPRRLHTPELLGAALSPQSIDRPEARPLPGPGGPEIAAPRPTPTRARIPRQRQGLRAPMWVNLNPASAQGAWIDLAARPGLGLNGHGATAIVRTALCELHTHTPAVLIIPRALLDTLTDLPDRTTPGTDDQAPISDRVRAVEHPYEGLQHLVGHAHRDQTSSDPPLTPCVLVAAAPTSTVACDELAHTLAGLRSRPAAVLLLGFWPHGAALDINPDHRVITHHLPAGADLTHQQLHPTTADELAHALTDRPAEPQPAEPQQPALASVDSDTTSDDRLEPPPPTTPLMLRVLGPVELHYHPPTPTDDTADGRDSERSRDDTIAIGPLPRLARELLAYLAGNPKGATLETLVDILCPHSTAIRPETALYNAKSRLHTLLTEASTNETIHQPITASGGRWHLDSTTIDVDYWALLPSASLQPETPAKRRRYLHTAVTAYQGLFAAELTGVWAHKLRSSASNRHLKLITELIEVELNHSNTTTSLELLERAREIEPNNQTIYRTIITIQLQQGQHDHAKDTYNLLRAHLAENDDEPDQQTRRLAAQIEQLRRGA